MKWRDALAWDLLKQMGKFTGEQEYAQYYNSVKPSVGRVYDRVESGQKVMWYVRLCLSRKATSKLILDITGRVSAEIPNFYNPDALLNDAKLVKKIVKYLQKFEERYSVTLSMMLPETKPLPPDEIHAFVEQTKAKRKEERAGSAVASPTAAATPAGMPDLLDLLDIESPSLPAAAPPETAVSPPAPEALVDLAGLGLDDFVQQSPQSPSSGPRKASPRNFSEPEESGTPATPPRQGSPGQEQLVSDEPLIDLGTLAEPASSPDNASIPAQTMKEEGEGEERPEHDKQVEEEDQTEPSEHEERPEQEEQEEQASQEEQGEAEDTIVMERQPLMEEAAREEERRKEEAEAAEALEAAEKERLTTEEEQAAREAKVVETLETPEPVEPTDAVDAAVKQSFAEVEEEEASAKAEVEAGPDVGPEIEPEIGPEAELPVQAEPAAEVEPEAEVAHPVTQPTTPAVEAPKPATPMFSGPLDLPIARLPEKALPNGLDALYLQRDSISSPGASLSTGTPGNVKIPLTSSPLVRDRPTKSPPDFGKPGRPEKTRFAILGERVSSQEHYRGGADERASWMLFYGQTIRPGYYEGDALTCGPEEDPLGRVDYWRCICFKDPKWAKGSQLAARHPTLLERGDPMIVSLRLDPRQLKDQSRSCTVVPWRDRAPPRKASQSLASESPPVEQGEREPNRPLILQWFPRPSDSTAAIEKQGKCPNCGQDLLDSKGKVKPGCGFCCYTGKYFCNACSKKFSWRIIPSAVLHNFSFAELEVSETAASDIDYYYPRPEIPMDELTGRLLKEAELLDRERQALEEYIALRKRLKYFYDHCIRPEGDARIPGAEAIETSIRAELSGEKYVPIDTTNCSLADLCNFRSGGASSAERASKLLSDALLDAGVVSETGKKRYLVERCPLCGKKVSLKSYEEVVINSDGKPTHSRCLGGAEGRPGSVDM